MGAVEPVRTERLLLRRFTEQDRAPFAAINADPVVMEHYPSTLGRAESDAFVDRIESSWRERGWGLWAVEVVAPAAPDEAPGFVGYTGLWPADHVAPGLVEVGWRLAHAAWGRGYAPEAATAALRLGFDDLGLDEIVSFTVPQNANSRRVMEKIGLRHRPERDFDHPSVDPVASPHLVRHVLYAIDRATWVAHGGASEWAGEATRR
ncbi:GNAT family N-acetyltransferase [Dermatobacter hominis]|uniref:GNAT family N-acetyltransferase n=1 Tax=Dermatobacter hominis TaxID=2884263 RepID=UPI001D0F8BCE|nr:GNAT family N-acetyltransferase [Dermatobacter hominis]UDY34183.1 GNAT family N-acetyltransferase [Dermatobacter hominis]